MTAPKFMIVDDDKAVLDVTSAILSSMGCKVEEFSDGDKAFEVLQKPDRADEFDAVFLDVMMPGISGYELLTKIREQEHLKKIPIIMLTAMGNYFQIMEGYNAGSDYYLVKPVTKDQLVYALDLILSPEDKVKDKKFFLPEA